MYRLQIFECSSPFQTNSCSHLCVHSIVGLSKNLVTFLFNFSLGALAQCDKMFNCTFSGCSGTNLTCYCSVQSNVLAWWDSNNTFCTTVHKNSMPSNPSDNVSIETVATNSTGLTSKLVWRSISTKLNGNVIGCSRNLSCSADQNPNFTLFVTGCQGNSISVKQKL